MQNTKPTLDSLVNAISMNSISRRHKRRIETLDSVRDQLSGLTNGKLLSTLAEAPYQI